MTQTAPKIASPPLAQESERLRAQLDPRKLPAHVAIIMDGNGRWARERGLLDRIRGHEAGSESVREMVRACGELGIKVLTLYAFSVENWNRPKTEVTALMALLQKFLLQERDEIHTNNVRLIVSGRIADLPVHVQETLQSAIDESSLNTGLTLNLALSYGGRAEILDAVKRIARDAKAGALDPDALTEQNLAGYMYHPEIPDPDLLIRTSGEMRISNFLLWQIAYAEIYVSPTLWPDFRCVHLYEALINFQSRERRFGKVLNA